MSDHPGVMPRAPATSVRWETERSGITPLLTGLLVFCAAVFFAPGFIDNVDSRVCFHSAENLLDHGTFALREPDSHELRFEWTVRSPDGQVYSKFGVGATLVLVPFVAAARMLPSSLPKIPGSWEEVLCSFSSCFYIALAAALMVSMLVRELGVARRTALLATLGWIFGTYQATYSGSTYRETALAFLLVLGLRAALAARRRDSPGLSLLAGCAAGLLILTKSAMVVTVPFLLSPLLGGAGWFRRVLSCAVPVALAGASVMLTNHLWFGGVFESGYLTQPGVFTTPILVGLRSYAVDPDLSLPLFAPAFALAAAGVPLLGLRSRRMGIAAVGVFAAVVLVHAPFDAPGGGTSYGPRYLLSGIALVTAPGLALLLDRRGRAARALLPALLAVAAAAQVPSLLLSPYEYHTIRGRLAANGDDISTLPPHLLVNLRLLALKLEGYDRAYPLDRLIDDGAGKTYEVPSSEQGFFTWWAMARRKGFPAGAVAGAVALLTLALAVLCWRTTRQAHRGSR